MDAKMTDKTEILSDIDDIEADIAAVRAKVVLHWPDVDQPGGEDPAPGEGDPPVPEEPENPGEPEDPEEPEEPETPEDPEEPEDPGTPVDPEDPPTTPPPGPTSPPAAGAYKFQGGPWFMRRWNTEGAPANLFKCNIGNWFVGDRTANLKLDEQYIDQATGMPMQIPAGVSKISSDYYFDRPTGFEGHWVVEAIGDNPIISAGLMPNVNKISDARFEFVVDGSFKPVLTVVIDAIGPGGLQDIILCRIEDEQRIKAGEKWGTRFLNEANRYDIIRTMDLQLTNGTFVNRANLIAPEGYKFWGSQGHRYASLPLEHALKLGQEADCEIWLNAPLHLGFPYDWKDPRITGGANTLGSLQLVASQKVDEIFSSNEWDLYADRLVSSLTKANYDPNKMLYIELGNEIWNAGGYGFLLQTQYANGIGQHLTGNNHQNKLAHGHLSMRLILAVEAAMQRAGLNQAITYVFAGQAAVAWGTKQYLIGADQFCKSRGLAFADYAAKIGVSVASYWGASWDKQMGFAAWNAAIAADPDAAAKTRADFLVNGPANSTGTLNWIVKQFHAHAAEAQKYGVKMIGAYEGGNHDSPPKQIPRSFYDQYAWGPEGARVNTEVQKALIAAFPGIILSNYVLFGPAKGGQPWHDGSPENPTDMSRSWDAFKRP